MADIVKAELKKEIIEKLSNPDLQDLSEAQLKKIAQLLYIEKQKENLNNEIEKSKYNHERIKKSWLESYKSKQTRDMYLYALNQFENWIEKKKLHILDVKNLDVKEFVNELKNRDLANNSIRVIIAGISSFFRELVQNDYIAHNYFLNQKLPSKETKQKPAVPSDQEIEMYYQKLQADYTATGKNSHLTRMNAERNYLIFHLMVQYGLRVGIFQTLIIGYNGKVTGKSKGKLIEFSVSIELSERLRKIEWGKLKRITIQKMINRLTDRKYHPHSFRHYFAIQEYKKNKDIYRLQKLLNHSSIGITENYLVSLGEIKK